MMVMRQQSGIALITVLLIIALATVAAVSMTSRQQLDIRRTTNILLIEQAYMALLAAEETTIRLLIEDAKENQTDGFGDIWNDERLHTAVQAVGEFKVTNAVIEDLQGRFNINNLVESSRINVSQNNHQGFVRLLGLVGLSVDLADAAYDWIDNEPAQYNNGAEDDAYNGLEKPYQTPNLDMASASEINRLKGVNFSENREEREKIWDMLHTKDQKVLVALPQGTPVNVNTPGSRAIYQMLVKGLSDDQAESMFNLTQVGLGDDPPFASADAFWKNSPIDIAPADRMNISVSSEYFLLRAEAFNEDLVVYSNTILHRVGNSVSVVHRSYGKLGEI